MVCMLVRQFKIAFITLSFTICCFEFPYRSYHIHMNYRIWTIAEETASFSLGYLQPLGNLQEDRGSHRWDQWALSPIQFHATKNSTISKQKKSEETLRKQNVKNLYLVRGLEARPRIVTWLASYNCNLLWTLCLTVNLRFWILLFTSFME